MGYLSLVTLSHDDFDEMRGKKDFGLELAAACNDSLAQLGLAIRQRDYGVRVPQGAPEPVKGVVTTHNSTGFLALFRGELELLHANLDPGVTPAEAIGHALASMDLSNEDKTILLEAIEGVPPPSRRNDDGFLADPEFGPLSDIIDPAQPPAFSSSTPPGAEPTASILIPLQGGGDLKATFTWSLGWNPLELQVRAGVPTIEAGDSGKITQIPVPGGTYETNHDLDFEAFSISESDVRAHLLTRHLGQRFSSRPSTERGTFERMAFGLRDAGEVFGIEGYGPELRSFCLEFSVFTTARSDQGATTVRIKRGEGRPTPRLLTAIELINGHFRPWGADLEIYQGQIQPRRGASYTTTAARPITADTDVAEAETSLWQSFRIDLGLSLAEICGAFRLPSGTTDFYSVKRMD